MPLPLQSVNKRGKGGPPRNLQFQRRADNSHLRQKQPVVTGQDTSSLPTTEPAVSDGSGSTTPQRAGTPEQAQESAKAHEPLPPSNIQEVETRLQNLLNGLALGQNKKTQAEVAAELKCLDEGLAKIAPPTAWYRRDPQKELRKEIARLKALYAHSELNPSITAHMNRQFGWQGRLSPKESLQQVRRCVDQWHTLDQKITSENKRQMLLFLEHDRASIRLSWWENLFGIGSREQKKLQEEIKLLLNQLPSQ